jgi:hypothetical protein
VSKTFRFRVVLTAPEQPQGTEDFGLDIEYQPVADGAANAEWKSGKAIGLVFGGSRRLTKANELSKRNLDQLEDVAFVVDPDDERKDEEFGEDEKLVRRAAPISVNLEHRAAPVEEKKENEPEPADAGDVSPTPEPRVSCHSDNCTVNEASITIADRVLRQAAFVAELKSEAGLSAFEVEGATIKFDPYSIDKPHSEAWQVTVRSGFRCEQKDAKAELLDISDDDKEEFQNLEGGAFRYPPRAAAADEGSEGADKFPKIRFEILKETQVVPAEEGQEPVVEVETRLYKLNLRDLSKSKVTITKGTKDAKEGDVGKPEEKDYTSATYGPYWTRYWAAPAPAAGAM